jgi:cytoskeleton protein RodZ
MAAAAGGDIGAGIGTRLRAAREKKGLTVLQAAEKLHVDPRILESLESEDFAALGAPVYVKGHMRHFAELVGEQPAELQELYTNSTRAAPVQPDLTHIPRGLPQADSGKFVGPAVVVIVAIAALGGFWWLVNAPGQKPQPTEVQDSAQNTAAPKVESGSPPEPPTPALPPVTPGTGKSVAASTPATSPAAVRTVAATESSATAPPPTRTKQGELTLKFSSDSWAEVYDASGQRLFYDVGAASSAHTVRGLAPMRVVLGNAAGVAVEFNGRPAPIPSTVKPDGSVHFIINAHGRAVPATEGN